MAVRIQFRRGASTDWAAANPILSQGEPGYDSTLGDLKIGDGSTAWSALGFAWIRGALLTAKGDILARSSTAPVRVPVGADGSVLTADSAQPSGIKWAAPAFVGARAYSSGSLTLTTAIDTALPLNSETYDTNAIHDTATNTSRMTVPAGFAGKWQFVARVHWNAGVNGIRRLSTAKNGVIVESLQIRAGDGTNGDSLILTTVLPLVAGDYVEMYGYQNNGGDLLTVAGSQYMSLTAIYMGQ